MILVTGNGFIGGAIAGALGEAALTIRRSGGGDDAIGFDLVDFAESDKLASRLESKNITSIIHTAAVTPWSSNPDFSDDLKMAKTLVNLCDVLRIKDVFFLSGWNVYDMSGEPPFDENTKPKPLNEYGESKLSVENYLTQHLHCTNLISLRLASVYGPGQVSSGLIPNLVDAALNKHQIKLTSLTTRRDYIYIKDVVRAIMILSNQDHDRNTSINIGSGRSYAVREVAEIIRQVVDQLYDEHINIEESSHISEGFPPDNTLAVNKAKERGLLEGVTPFEIGIREYIEWKKHANLL